MHPLINLAKQAVENYIKEKKIISSPQGLPEGFLEQKAGTFVTIMKNEELRGCLGTYLPTRENIVKEIIHNAIAATEDHRFKAIQEEELPYFSYIVYILGKPELVKDMTELNPKKFGIIIKTEQKTGLLLPDLAGVDIIEEQIAICCQKSGIDPQRDKIFIYKFTVKKYAQ